MVMKIYIASLTETPRPVRNPFQRPLLSVLCMTSTPDGPAGAAARKPIAIPLRTISKMETSIIYLIFLAECQIQTKAEIEAEIMEWNKLRVELCLELVNSQEEIDSPGVKVEEKTHR